MTTVHWKTDSSRKPFRFSSAKIALITSVIDAGIRPRATTAIWAAVALVLQPIFLALAVRVVALVLSGNPVALARFSLTPIPAILLVGLLLFLSPLAGYVAERTIRRLEYCLQRARILEITKILDSVLPVGLEPPDLKKAATQGALHESKLLGPLISLPPAVIFTTGALAYLMSLSPWPTAALITFGLAGGAALWKLAGHLRGGTASFYADSAPRFGDLLQGILRSRRELLRWGSSTAQLKPLGNLVEGDESLKTYLDSYSNVQLMSAKISLITGCLRAVAVCLVLALLLLEESQGTGEAITYFGILWICLGQVTSATSALGNINLLAPQAARAKSTRWKAKSVGEATHPSRREHATQVEIQLCGGDLVLIPQMDPDLLLNCLVHHVRHDHDSPASVMLVGICGDSTPTKLTVDRLGGIQISDGHALQRRLESLFTETDVIAVPLSDREVVLPWMHDVEIIFWSETLEAWSGHEGAVYVMNNGGGLERVGAGGPDLEVCREFKSRRGTKVVASEEDDSSLL